MNKESKLNLNASNYAIRHFDSNKTYNALEVHKMLCDAYIAGNNDTLDDKDEEIRKALINVFATHKDYEVFFGVSVEDIRAWLEKQGKPEDMGEVSDGYHTFNELYYYRMLYNAAFFNRLPKDWVHKSKRHHDGEECFGGGWFIVMANLPTGQISNHYELKDWDLFQIPEKDIADEWDGHTPQQAAERLHKYLLEKQGEQSIAISVDKMVDEFENFKVISCGRIPSFMEIDAYRKGVNDALSKILIKEEKPITIGSKKAEGKLGEMIAANKEPAESGEDKELSHKEVTKKSDKVWNEEDEEMKDLIDEISCHNDDVDYETHVRITRWLNELKQRLS